jgi:hypothetical protein
MARETITRLVDDLDGSTATETVSFSWQGTSYEIDLSKKNAGAFEKLLLPYIGSSRKVTSARKSTVKRASGSKAAELAAIRAWARSNGYNVSERGRIASTVVEAYHAS